MPAPPAAAVTPDSDNKTAELQRAFAMFNQVSAELTQAYEALQARVASLTEQLAVANGELRRQFQEKEALSERLSSLLDALPAGVVLLDAAASVVAVNPAALSFFGPHIVGRHWGDVARDYLEPTLTVGEWLCGGGRVSIAESALPSAGGKILLVHDVTAAHQMKTELERNQRLAPGESSRADPHTQAIAADGGCGHDAGVAENQERPRPGAAHAGHPRQVHRQDHEPQGKECTDERHDPGAPHSTLLVASG